MRHRHGEGNEQKSKQNGKAKVEDSVLQQQPNSLPLLYNWTEVERHDASDLRLLLRGLSHFTPYEILLQAFNQYGRGPVAKITAMTDEDGRDIQVLD